MTLPQAEFEAIYHRVPRLTVELVITSSSGGLLLTRRTTGPCAGLWHLPGGTVRYGERLTEAVQRVGAGELGLEIVAGELLGYIEYPSHLAQGIDWPVGLAFRSQVAPESRFEPVEDLSGWFEQLPGEMHDEQREFCRSHGLAT